MRKVLLTLAASLAIATPAMANEARVEARAGIFWEPGHTDAMAGVAAGYDFDVGTGAFAGAEISADKVLDSAHNRVAWGFTGRLGLTPSPDDKVFASAGYTTKFCGSCQAAEHLGIGYQRGFASRLYGKVEYRHYFINSSPNANAVTAGVGMRF